MQAKKTKPVASVRKSDHYSAQSAKRPSVPTFDPHFRPAAAERQASGDGYVPFRIYKTTD